MRSSSVAPGSGVHRHARRLVYYSKIGVFEHDVEGNVFRHRPQRRLRRGSEDSDAFPTAQPQRRPRNRIIHQHQLLRDELLDPGAAGFRKMRDQKLVQPFAGIFSRRGN